MAYGTPQTQVRLTAEDKEKLSQVRAAYDLPSDSQTIRHTIDLVHRQLPEKLRKNSKETA